jgi:hypothetical protein
MPVGQGTPNLGGAEHAPWEPKLTELVHEHPRASRNRAGRSTIAVLGGVHGPNLGGAEQP